MASKKGKNPASTKRKGVAQKGKKRSSAGAAKKASSRRPAARKRKAAAAAGQPAKGKRRLRRIERVATLWEAMRQLSFKDMLKIVERELKKGRGTTKRAKKR